MKNNASHFTSPLLTSKNTKKLWVVGHTGVAICLVHSSNIPKALLYFSNNFSMFRYTQNTLFSLGKFYVDYSTSNTSISLFRQSHPAHFQPASFDSQLTPWFEWSRHGRGMPGHICQLCGFKPLSCSYLMIYSKLGSDHLQCLLGDWWLA